ncbi:Immunity protein 35 [Actinokineospora alba]|uniref:Immunity protein 35 n=1 Tax=Actinokineospora alba TaxID=504798 RepID=A0A1H0T4R9_9PSEU|nr:YrhB domain-containing protein [Actinokineospora alba]TDP66367.1 immunity protein 35 of polymorphic toxin system [Actinokineospora alba]SDJ23126.1 Immunity protein 35 [Actinokineospora alba]SDP49033.1 Immunity protein 35 [Actinokineospora alba]
MLLQDAYETAQALLDAMVRPDSPDVVICSCTEFPNAWAFGYNTRRFLAHGELSACLVGGGPVVVPKSGKDAFLSASGSPVDTQIGHL